jgi:hypothetical protein
MGLWETVMQFQARMVDNFQPRKLFKMLDSEQPDSNILLRFGILPDLSAVGEGAHRSVMAFAKGSLLLIVDSGPVAEANRLASKLVGGLAEEFRASPAKVNPSGICRFVQ